MTMDPRLNAWALTWADVDPATHPFDPSAVHDVVRAVAPPLPPESRSAWVRAVSIGLVEHYGRWAIDWQGQATGHTVHGG